MDARTDGILRLHAAACGTVWFGNDATPAADSGLPADAFFASERYAKLLDTARVVRLLGSHGNAALVVRLQERLAGRDQVVQLGSPAVVPAAWRRANPSAVLHHLWQLPSGATLSGSWHDLQAGEARTYAMIAMVAADYAGGDATPPTVPAVATQLAVGHPAWPAVTFGLAATDAACLLLCDIIDPRWYQHPSHPTRLSRLYAHLGLTPQNMACYAGTTTVSDVNFWRAWNAVRVWYNPASQLMWAGRESDNYLFRVLAAHKNDLARGLLRATQCLVALVHEVWTDAVRASHADFRFQADRFFKTAPEAAAFTAWRGEIPCAS